MLSKSGDRNMSPAKVIKEILNYLDFGQCSTLKIHKLIISSKNGQKLKLATLFWILADLKQNFILELTTDLWFKIKKKKRKKKIRIWRKHIKDLLKFIFLQEPKIYPVSK